MKRVCIIRQKSYPAQRNLRRSAETLVKEGYEVDVICVGFKGQSKHETMNGVNIHRIYFSYHRDNVFWYIFDYISFFVLAFLILAVSSIRRRYDVIEIQTMPDFLVFTAIFPKLMGSKVILYMFENTTQLFVSKFRVSRSHIFARLVNLVAKVSARYADSVIVSDGPLHKQEVESYGIPKEKVTLVLNVPDESVFKLDPAQIDWDGNHFHLVVVSTVLRRYGIQTLIGAMPGLVKDIPEIKVHIIGDGQYRPYLETMAQSKGVESYLDFMGYVPYEDVPSCIARADICVAPAIEDVGAPNKIFEYSALNKPTVASALPGIMSVFDDSCVFYYPPSREDELTARILELYHNVAKREGLAASAHEVYRQFRWPLMKQAYLGVYQRLLG